jgi:hypothetical protein
VTGNNGTRMREKEQREKGTRENKRKGGREIREKNLKREVDQEKTALKKKQTR